jgi:hypothetical protein
MILVVGSDNNACFLGRSIPAVLAIADMIGFLRQSHITYQKTT